MLSGARSIREREGAPQMGPCCEHIPLAAPPLTRRRGFCCMHAAVVVPALSSCGAFWLGNVTMRRL